MPEPPWDCWIATVLPVLAFHCATKAAFSLGLADATKSARRARAWAAGVNWYLNRNVKLVMNYENTTFIGGAVGGDRSAEHALLSRFQIAF